MSKQSDSKRIRVVITNDERKIDFWLKGTATGGYRFCAKIFDEGSIHGIDNGRVSKLEIRNDGKILVNYDRGWDVKPNTPEVEAVYKRIMAKLNALDKVFEADKPKDLLGKIEDNKQKVNRKTPAKTEKPTRGDEIC